MRLGAKLFRLIHSFFIQNKGKIGEVRFVIFSPKMGFQFVIFGRDRGTDSLAILFYFLRQIIRIQKLSSTSYLANSLQTNKYVFLLIHAEVTTAKSMDSFKSRFDKHWTTINPDICYDVNLLESILRPLEATNHG